MTKLSPFFLAGLIALASLSAFESVDTSAGPFAVHFGPDGVADGWTTPETYLILVLAALVGAPLLLVGLFAGLPRVTSGRGQIPNHDFWFAPARRQETLAFLTRHSCWLGSLTAAVVYGIHALILRANSSVPPTLPINRLGLTVFLYLGGLAWWLSVFLRRFSTSHRR